MDQHHTPQSHHPQSLAQTINTHQPRVEHNAYASQTMGHRHKFVEHHQKHNKGEALAIFINKTDNTKINIYRCNSGSIQYQLRPIPFNACLHKSKYRRTQANIQHLDRYVNRILTHLLVLKMRQLV
jgi:hypothetical protein